MRSLVKKPNVPILLACCWTTWRAAEFSSQIRRASTTCAASIKWGSVGTFQSSPHPASPPPTTNCNTFLRMLGGAPGQTCLWCTHAMQSQQFACSENSMPKPAFDALRWRLMPKLVTSQRGSCHSAHFANTWVAMTCPTSTISSAHITM